MLIKSPYTVEGLKKELNAFDEEIPTDQLLEELDLQHTQIDYGNGHYEGAFLVYLEGGTALIPFFLSPYEGESVNELFIDGIKYIGEDDIHYLERALRWYQTVSGNLEEALKKQRLRKLFQKK